MARCGQCGTSNREGAVFCQNCGQRIEEVKPKPVSVVTSAVSGAGPKCGSCGTVNVPGMNFCKMCGSSLAAPAAAAPDPGATKVPCAACGKQTPSGFAFCQHCGHRLAPAAGPIGAAPPAAVAATMMAEAPQLPVRPSEAFAATLGPSATGAVVEALSPNTIKTNPVGKDTLPEPHVYATLVVVRRDGSDGDSVRVTVPTFDIGRTEGGLTFADDVFLAPRHVRITFAGGGAQVRALDSVNGVYVRLRSAFELHPGDQFLVGKELIRYEPIVGEEREATLTEHGVRLFGTVPREAWARLRQITATGTTRDLWHIARAELVLGREEGDVTFPDDEFMSRRHAAVRRGTPRPKLEDLSSSNGTFVRVRGDHVLHTGDLLRFGDQLLRVEL